MRVFIIGLFLVIFFLLGVIINLILWVVGKINPKAKLKASQVIVGIGFRIILFVAGTKKTIIGKENIPKDIPVLYVGNHRSYFDILLTHTSINSPVGYVAKKEMIKIPFLRTWMRNIGCLFLDRDNIKEGLKTILQGVEYLKNGLSIFIFPEGTRCKEEEMLPFKEGSLKMAEKAKCPIVPVAIVNSAAVLEANKGFKIKSAKVKVIYCKPVIPSELEPEQRKHLGAYVQSIIKDTLEANK